MQSDSHIDQYCAFSSFDFTGSGPSPESSVFPFYTSIYPGNVRVDAQSLSDYHATLIDVPRLGGPLRLTNRLPCVVFRRRVRPRSGMILCSPRKFIIYPPCQLRCFPRQPGSSLSNCFRVRISRVHTPLTAVSTQLCIERSRTEFPHSCCHPDMDSGLAALSSVCNHPDTARHKKMR